MKTFVSNIRKLSLVVLSVLLFAAVLVTFLEVITPGRSQQALQSLCWCLVIGVLMVFVDSFDK